MNLLPGEKILVQSDDEALTLTTHRIRRDTKAFGRAIVQSMTLDSVTSCELVVNSNPTIFVLGFVALAAARDLFGVPRPGGLLGSLLAGATIFIVTYFGSRAPVLKIASSGGAIIQPTKGMKTATLVEFIDAVERAKVARHLTP